MTCLADLPCLWRAPTSVSGPALLRVQKYLPQAVQVDPADAAAQADALNRMTEDHVLVIAADTLPYSALPSLSLDPVLAGLQQPYAYLCRNTVTEEFTDISGPAVWPRDVLIAAVAASASLPRPGAVIPTAMAQWYCNPDARTAFENGFKATRELMPQADTQTGMSNLVLRASIGADAQYGTGWIMGACHALLEKYDPHTAQTLEDTALADTALRAQRAVDLCRQVRLDTDFTVFALSPGESRMVKDAVFALPPAARYRDLADLLDQAGKAGRARASLYREAAAWQWGDGDRTVVSSKASAKPL